MKKIAIAIIALASLSFASCKKDYTCECKKTRTTGGITITVEDGKYVFDDTRARAESRCNDEEETGDDYTRDCEIK